jgi:hypothetical protein
MSAQNLQRLTERRYEETIAVQVDLTYFVLAAVTPKDRIVPIFHRVLVQDQAEDRVTAILSCES